MTALASFVEERAATLDCTKQLLEESPHHTKVLRGVFIGQPGGVLAIVSIEDVMICLNAPVSPCDVIGRFGIHPSVGDERTKLETDI